MSEKQTKYLPAILLILLSLIWGSSFILIKYSLTAFGPGQVGALRLVIAGIFLLPWAMQGLRNVPKDRWKYVVLVGLSGNFFPAFLFAWAQTGLASSLTGVLNALTPIFTLLIGLIAFAVPLRKEQLIGLVLGFLGSLFISLVGSGGQLGGINEYALLVVAACAFYAISANTLKSHLNNVRPMSIVALALLSVAPLALAYLLSTDFVEKVSQPENWEKVMPALGYLCVLGIVGTALALVAFNKLIQLTSAVSATSVTYLIPIVAVIWGLIDGEQLFPLHYIGMGLIILGVYLVNRKRK